MTLIPCASCARHVRENERACPFCSASREPTHARAPMTVTRLGRAAMFAFGTTTVAALSTLTACGNEAPTTTVTPPSTGTGPIVPSTVPVPETSIVAPYGAPPDPRPEPAPPTTTAAPPVPPEAESRAPHHPPHLPEPSVVALYGGPSGQ